MIAKLCGCDVLNESLVAKFLAWCENNLWIKYELDDPSKTVFNKACEDFYHKKTNDRLKKFYEKTAIEDERGQGKRSFDQVGNL